MTSTGPGRRPFLRGRREERQFSRRQGHLLGLSVGLGAVTILGAVKWALGDADELVKLLVAWGAAVPIGAVFGFFVYTQRKAPPAAEADQA